MEDCEGIGVNMASNGIRKSPKRELMTSETGLCSNGMLFEAECSLTTRDFRRRGNGFALKFTYGGR